MIYLMARSAYLLLAVCPLWMSSSSAALAQADRPQTLQEKFGANWDCSYITSDALYKKCVQCDLDGRDIVKIDDNAGRCALRSPHSEHLAAKRRANSGHSQPAQTTPTGLWAAVTCGVSDEDDSLMGSGTAFNYASELDAIHSAVESCKKAGGGKKCTEKVVSFSAGCAFVALGGRDGNVHCRSGRTADEATRKCTEGGFDCKKPIGGCLRNN